LQEVGIISVQAFVAFFRSEDMLTPFSLSLTDLHTHLVALQTLLSFLTSRELKEIVRTRLNIPGGEQERWTVVQGVLDVMRDAGGEDEDVGIGVEVDVKMGGRKPMDERQDVTDDVQDVDQTEAVELRATKAMGKGKAKSNDVSVVGDEDMDVNPRQLKPFRRSSTSSERYDQGLLETEQPQKKARTVVVEKGSPTHLHSPKPGSTRQVRDIVPTVNAPLMPALPSR
jgi:hypothetical protein